MTQEKLYQKPIRYEDNNDILFDMPPKRTVAVGKSPDKATPCVIVSENDILAARQELARSIDGGAFVVTATAKERHDAANMAQEKIARKWLAERAAATDELALMSADLDALRGVPVAPMVTVQTLDEMHAIREDEVAA